MFTSLKITHPHLESEWSDENRLFADFSAGSGYKALWVGTCGHTWSARISDRTIKNSTCPYCSNKKVLQGFNDLLTTEPTLATEYSPKNKLKVTEITAGSLRKVNWIGTCSHKWVATPVSRRGSKFTKGTGCPFCCNQKILVGFNDFAKIYPKLLFEWADTNTILPTQVSRVSRTRIDWICSKQHRWTATIKDRTDRGGTGCPRCVDRNNPAIERFIFKLLLSEYPDTQMQYQTGLKWPSGQKIVVDFYIPSLKLAIEWDGSKWHENREHKDVFKSMSIIDSGLKILRLRESRLLSLNVQNVNYLDIKISHIPTVEYLKPRIIHAIELLK